ncbi:MAG: RnfABCDGE type electron transport complex subunit D [Phycisphaerae bacterium]
MIPEKPHHHTVGTSTAASALDQRLCRQKPFLLWPVARREFYQTITISVLLPLLWGIGVFGFRAALIILATLAAAVLAHFLLARFTVRGRLLTWNHTLACALLASGLTAPLLPWFWAIAQGAGLVALIWIAGLPGQQRFHIALLAPLAITAMLPLVGRWPVLVLDRLTIGDIHHSVPVRVYQWPQHSPQRGVDAVRLPRPEQVIEHTLGKIAINPASAHSRRELRAMFAMNLPSPSALLLGGVPGRIGTVGILAIILAGLYLSYRQILLPGAWGLFLISVLAGLIFGPLSPRVLHHEFWQSIGGLWYFPPERAIALLFYEICSSDFLFASVFILALPGTLPIEPLARKVFLVAAGLAAAFLHRMALPIPPATVALLFLQPVAPALDLLLHRRSWLLN